MTNVNEYNKQHKLFCLEMFSIVFGLSLSIMSDAQSAPNCPTGTTLNVDCWSCGDDCTAYLSNDEINADGNKQLNITGSGKMNNYTGTSGEVWHPSVGGYHYDVPSAPWGTQLKNITSLNINGVSNIGEFAFIGMGFIKNVHLSDSVKSIEYAAFDNMALENIKLPESIMAIHDGALAWNAYETIIVPDSVTMIGKDAFYGTVPIKGIFIPEAINSIHDNAFSGVAAATIYCPKEKESLCAYSGDTKLYTKDENGVYKVDDLYYSSPENMVQVIDGVLSPKACNDYESCKVKALEYEEQKAANMAGGALCATKEGCMELINMANKKDVCSSIADCNNYAKSNNLSSILCKNKEQVVWQAHCYDEYPFTKKRWTPAEANEWLHDGNDNFVIITFKH